MPTLSFPPAVEELDWSGERFVVGRTGQIEFEHYHRYLFAAQYCGGRAVLDIACGAGYGSFVLAQVAGKVTGVDVAADVVAVAQARYGRPGLRFAHGSCLAIPLAEASVDVVVSFETIEHIAEHEAFLTEVRRVLRPGGVLLLSTPDRPVYSPPGSEPNPFHLRELDRGELSALLRTNFKHQRLGLQKATAGSVLLPAEGAAVGFEVFDRIDAASFHATGVLTKAPYLLAVASDAPLPEPRWGILDDAVFLHDIQQRVMDAEAKLQEEVGRLGAEIQRLNLAFAESQAEVVRVNQAFAASQAEVSRVSEAFAERAAETLRAHEALAERQREARRLSEALVATEAKLARRDAEVASGQVALTQAKAREAAAVNQFEQIRGEIDDLRGTLAETQARASAVQADLERQLSEMRGSTSWRLSRPLRVVKRALFEGATGRELLRQQLAGPAPETQPEALPASVARVEVEEVQPRRLPARGTPPLILIVTHDGTRTGAPMVCLNLLKELARRGECRLACVSMAGGELLGEFASLCPTHLLSSFSDRPPEDALREVLLHLEALPDLAFASTVATARLLPVLTEAGIPVVSLVHELPTSIDYYGADTIRTINDQATDIVFGSNYVREAVAAMFGASGAHPHVIPTGYPSPIRSEGDREQARQRVIEAAQLPPDARIVLGCGTIQHRKGVDLFNQSAARVVRSPGGEAAHFVWIGPEADPTYAAWLRHDRTHLGLTDRVHFLGGVDDVDQWIAGADVFLLPSREDPCPLVNLVALGSGVPSIAFAGAGGAPESIGTEAGFVVPYLDVEAMAQATLRMLADVDELRRRGAAGRRRFEQEHEISIFTDRLLALKPVLAEAVPS